MRLYMMERVLEKIDFRLNLSKNMILSSLWWLTYHMTDLTKDPATIIDPKRPPRERDGVKKSVKHVNWTLWIKYSRYKQVSRPSCRGTRPCNPIWATNFWTHVVWAHVSSKRGDWHLTPFRGSILNALESFVGFHFLCVWANRFSSIFRSLFHPHRWHSRTVLRFAASIWIRLLSATIKLPIFRRLRWSWKTITWDNMPVIGIQNQIPGKFLLVTGESWMR